MKIYESDIKKNTEIDKVKDAKCINCKGIMKFEISSNSLVCPYCGYSVKISGNIEEVEEKILYKQFNRDNQDFQNKIIICKSCGAQSFVDSSKIISVCEFCGSNQLIQKNENALEPDGIIPFEIDPEEIENYIKEWLENQKFCLPSFKKKGEIVNVHGVYLPYWAFDANTQNTFMYYDEEKETTIRGTFEKKINDYLILASSNYDIKELKEIEPFDTGKNKKFKTQYLSGYDAQYYDIGLKDAWAEGVKAIKKTLMENTGKNYSEFRTAYSEVTYKYLLVPIWFIDVNYKKKIYRFLMNGQTGRITGKVPAYILKYIIYAIIILLGISLISLFGPSIIDLFNSLNNGIRATIMFILLFIWLAIYIEYFV